VGADRQAIGLKRERPRVQATPGRRAALLMRWR